MIALLRLHLALQAIKIMKKLSLDMKKIFLFVLFGINFTNQISSQNVIDTFFRAGFNNGGQIILFDDHTFAKKSYSGSCVIDSIGSKSVSKTLTGIYKINNSKLSFIPLNEVVINWYGPNSDTIIQKPKSTSAYFISEYSIIKYEGVKYLFAEESTNGVKKLDLRFKNHFMYFVHQFNESDGFTSGSHELWRNVKKPNKILNFKKDIIELFPKKYQELILDKPIHANVIKIQILPDSLKNNRKGKWYQVTLDVGKLDGVYSGLGFYFPKKNDRICRLIISNVYDKTCVGLIKYINDLHSKECIECKSYSTKNIKSWIIPEK